RRRGGGGPRHRAPTPGGKQRWVHNTSFPLPVLSAMLAGHFSFTYGPPHSWAILVWLFVVGAAIRHYFIRRHAGETLWWIPVGCALAIAGIAVWLRPPGPAPAQPGAAPVPFARVRPIVAARCQPCHSLHPTQSGFTSAPANVVLDTPAQIHALAAQIKAVAVDSTVMPLGNATKITQIERDLLGQWIDQGARIK